eukprot:scaffold4973_cov135-Cylindrotheca_fusiformis.AAC.35
MLQTPVRRGKQSIPAERDSRCDGCKLVPTSSVVVLNNNKSKSSHAVLLHPETSTERCRKRWRTIAFLRTILKSLLAVGLGYCLLPIFELSKNELKLDFNNTTDDAPIIVTAAAATASSVSHHVVDEERISDIKINDAPPPGNVDFNTYTIPNDMIFSGAKRAGQAITLPRNTTSFCLLTKDDGEILNEWIAYHYHVLNLRRLIVAVDPLSTTSPVPLLQKWKDLFGMHIEIWKDEDYMPDYFLKGDDDGGDQDKIKDFVKNFQFQNNATMDEKRKLNMVNNHRFRQHTFVSRCLWEVKKSVGPRKLSWVAHVDTDEYIIINPKARSMADEMKPVVVPHAPSAGSLLKYLNGIVRTFPSDRLRRKCILMPRILYLPQTHDSKNKNNIIDRQNWNTDRFETLHWEVHRDLSEPTGLQKPIMDAGSLQRSHEIFREGIIHAVHQPLRSGGPADCLPLSKQPDLEDWNQFPLAVNHYVGSLERYLQREDIRRHESIWRKKAELNGTISDGWILGWLPSFVNDHGLEKVSQVLGDYQKKI